MLEVPPAVREKAVLIGAESWLKGLDDLVAGVAADWNITIGPAYPDSTEALVLQATIRDGPPVALKVILPQDEAALREITVLRADGGNGCAALLRHDLGRGALLLERLGPSLVDLQLPVRRRHTILVETARRVWRPVKDIELPSGAEKAAWLAEYVATSWEEAGRPLSRRTVDHALRCAESRRRAHDDERAVLVHGDVHQWNALQAGERFKLVDPDGLNAEPEYDLGVIMREDPVELLHEGARTRSGRLAAMSGLDENAIFEWGVVERVSTGLLLNRIGLQPVGRDMLAAAEVVAKEELR